MKISVPLISILSVLLFSVIIVQGGEWYINGNLHRRTITEWNQATYANKLATSGDMALASPKIKALFQKSGSVDRLRPFAVELVTCINEVASGEGYESMQVAEMTAGCMILMGW